MWGEPAPLPPMAPILMTNEEGVISPAIATTRDQIENLISSFVLHAMATGLTDAPQPAPLSAAAPPVPPVGAGEAQAQAHGGVQSQQQPSRCATAGGAGREERAEHARHSDEEQWQLQSPPRLQHQQSPARHTASASVSASNAAPSRVGGAALGSNRRHAWVGVSGTPSAGSKVGEMRAAQAIAAGVSPSDYIAARVCALISCSRALQTSFAVHRRALRVQWRVCSWARMCSVLVVCPAWMRMRAGRELLTSSCTSGTGGRSRGHGFPGRRAAAPTLRCCQGPSCPFLPCRSPCCCASLSFV